MKCGWNNAINHPWLGMATSYHQAVTHPNYKLGFADPHQLEQCWSTVEPPVFYHGFLPCCWPSILGNFPMVFLGFYVVLPSILDVSCGFPPRFYHGFDHEFQGGPMAFWGFWVAFSRSWRGSVQAAVSWRTLASGHGTTGPMEDLEVSLVMEAQHFGSEVVFFLFFFREISGKVGIGLY